MAIELDDELGGGVSDKIGAATKGSVGPDKDTALESLVIGDAPSSSRRGAKAAPGSSSSSTPEPMTAPIQGTGKARAGSRAEMMARMAEMEKTIAELREELRVAKSVGDEDNIKELGGLIAMALTVSSQFLAEKRGVHWLFDNETESTPIGMAWAVALAPYADILKKYTPWAMALGVTWMVVKPKLDEDKRLLLERDAKKKAESEA